MGHSLTETTFGGASLCDGWHGSDGVVGRGVAMKGWGDSV